MVPLSNVLKKIQLPAPILRFVDIVVMPLVVIFLAYEPNFAHGVVNYFESGIYSSYINDIFHGLIPYKDIYNQFGPLHHYIPALAMLLFGKTLVVLRGYFLAGEIVSLILAYWVCRLLIKNRFFAYLATILIVMEAHHPFWATRWGGIRFGFGYASLLCLIFFCKRGGLKILGWAGFFASLGLFHSEDVGLFSYLTAILSFTFYQKWVRPEEKREPTPQLIRAYLFGCLLAWLPFLGFLFFNGALGAYWEYILSLPDSRIWAQRLNPELFILRSLFPFILYGISFGYLFYRTLKQKDPSREMHCLFTLTAYGILTYMYAFRRIIGPQFTTVLPVVLIATFYLLNRIYEALIKKEIPLASFGLRFNRLVLIAFFVAGSVYSVLSTKNYYQNNLLNWIRYQRVKGEYLPDIYRVFNKSLPDNRRLNVERGGRPIVPSWQADEVERAVSYVREHTKETDSLLAFPDMGVFYFLCDRAHIGRFSVSGWAWTKPEWHKELLTALIEERPPVVLVRTVISNQAMSLGSREEILPDVLEYIKTHYVLKEEWFYLAIYALPDED